MKTLTLPLALSAAVLGLAACTPTQTPNSFSSNEAQRAQPVTFGHVLAVRPVEIRPGQTRLGTGTGAVLGGLAGSQLGSGTAANTAGAVVGAVAGGAVGSAAQGSRVTQGVELTVRLESGETIAVVQQGDIRDFRVDDRVRVVGTAENTRVAR
ncbi:glycine zipper 2TM domain-containing protein [Brevundimonas sp. Root1279]|uniref:glycine zipper 2TM domain-containing protein n=1 Tax=Brevundimonas sp. Root1279 TaxID=1736443 RepID=UPI0006FE01D1|nr:glycine zipper 2TM domain-containing protein [Brevundimonas sp. Root1279]KQW82533.1 hypothetical protein ASC65_09940 [Brevundimonas sp. Root1279]